MTRNQQLTSFGLYLQTARIEKKMSIETLSAETRIRVEVLKRLEAEEHPHLPNEVFVKGFIRNYAQAVGADVEEALKRYSANCALRNVTVERKTTPSVRADRFWPALVAAIMAVLLMAGLTLYIYTWMTAPPELTTGTSAAPIESKAAAPTGMPPVEPAAPSPAASVPQAVRAPEEETPAPPKSFLLEIRAVEETWLKIIVDNQNAQELTLKTDEVRQIQASSSFNLLIGNAGGVALKLNGAPVEVDGRSGQVVNLQLP